MAIPATSHMTVDVTGGPLCGYVCIAGEVDRAEEEDLAVALGRLADLHNLTVSVDSGGGDVRRVVTAELPGPPVDDDARAHADYLVPADRADRHLIQVAGLG